MKLLTLQGTPPVNNKSPHHRSPLLYSWDDIVQYVYLLLLVFVVSLFAACSNEPTEEEASSVGMVFFEGSFENALQLAANEEKLVFVDVYTTWCGPCIVMQDTVFPQPKVGEFFNSRFVNFKLDAEKEVQNGPEIAAKYEINVYPTYLILDSDGNEIARASSLMTGEQFIAMVSQMLGETESTFEKLQERYAAGERGHEFVQQYLMDAIVYFSKKEYPRNDMAKLREYWGEQQYYSDAATAYFARKTFPELLNPTDVHLILYYKDKSSRGDKIVELVLEHFDEFVELSSMSAMSQFFLNATWYASLDAAQSRDRDYGFYLDELEQEPLIRVAEYERNRDPDSGLVPERMRQTIDLIYYQVSEQWDTLFAHHTEVLSANPESLDAEQYNSAARSLMRSPNAEHQQFVLENVQTAFRLDSKNPLIAITYIEALSINDHTEEIHEIVEEFKDGLSDSAADQERLEIFNRISGGVLNASVEEEVQDDGQSHDH